MAAGRMLDEVKQFRDKQWREKVKGKPRFEFYRDPQRIKQMRDELLSLPNVDDRINELVNVDGFISQFVIIKIFEEINAIIEDKLKRYYRQTTQRTFTKDTVTEEMNRALKSSDFFTRSKSVTEHYLEIAEANPTSAITTEMVVSEVKSKIIDKIVASKVTSQRGSLSADSQAVLTSLIWNHVYLSCLIELYKQMDERQTAEGASLMIKMAKYLNNADLLLSPFVAIREISSHIAFTAFNDDATFKKLWQEAIVWMQGLYMRSFEKLPAENQNRETYTPIPLSGGRGMPTAENDETDKTLKEKIGGVTKITIADFHVTTMGNLLSQNPQLTPGGCVLQARGYRVPSSVSAAETVIEVPHPSETMPSPNPAPMPPSQAGELSSGLSMFHHPNTPYPHPATISVVATSLRSTVSSFVTESGTALDVQSVTAQEMTYFGKPDLSYEELINLSGISNPDDLEAINQINIDEVFVSALQGLLQGSSLIERQQRAVNMKLSLAKTHIESYSKAWFSTWWIPTILKARPHTEKVSSMVSSFTDQEADTSSKILDILNLWHEARGDSSLDLLQIATEQIRDIYRTLLISTPKPTLVSASVVESKPTISPMGQR